MSTIVANRDVFYLPLGTHPYHIAHAGAYCLLVHLSNSKRLVIPAVELIRFYFGSSSVLVRTLFRFPLTQDKLWTHAKQGTESERSSIDLAAGIAGTIYLASRKSVVGLGRLIVITTIMFAVGIAVFAVSSNIFLFLVSLGVAGFGAMTFAASCNTILQTILEEDKRGRVMSFFTVAFVGIAPFGSFGAGAMADTIGPRDTLLIGAACCLVGAIMFARNLPNIRQKVRPIYVKMGIIKEVAEGMETATGQPPL